MFKELTAQRSSEANQRQIFGKETYRETLNWSHPGNATFQPVKQWIMSKSFFFSLLYLTRKNVSLISVDSFYGLLIIIAIVNYQNCMKK